MTFLAYIVKVIVVRVQLSSVEAWSDSLLVPCYAHNNATAVSLPAPRVES